ncbi:MAG TPA: endonuclease/exonuclease/phosphatase family protein [Solirubrobacteraceae bacterium]|nr:endonuclease/exonuclease/phosphatase family protein [Solirubrobacteraceae bacterium]
MIVLRRALLLAVLAAVAACASPAAAQAGTVKVMTRNLDLGADLTPATRAGSLQQLVDAAGVILGQVDENDFRMRARGLAAEILRTKPDLVGLQEAALWRTAPCTENPLPPKASQVRYDYLRLLLDRLNAGARRYRLVVSQDEFDFEVYVNSDGNASTSAPSCPLGSELNGRLTMRDAILARRGRVTTSRARGGHFKTLLQVRPGGVAIDVTRGWTRVDARVPGAPPFRFVNTHLEAFDNQPSNHTNQGTDVGNGQIREAQAKELAARGGPARTGRRVILVGDLNSDVATEVKPGDGLAYRALLRRGFAERSTDRPLSCCLKADVLTTAGGGSRGDFDHQVDHVMTSAPGTVRLIRSAVTGLAPVNGFWSSDHAGVFSSLRVFAAARPRFTG